MQRSSMGVQAILATVDVKRGCIENLLRRSIPFFKPEQPFYTYSIDLLILQEGL